MVVVAAWATVAAADSAAATEDQAALATVDLVDQAAQLQEHHPAVAVTTVDSTARGGWTPARQVGTTIRVDTEQAQAAAANRAAAATAFLPATQARSQAVPTADAARVLSSGRTCRTQPHTDPSYLLADSSRVDGSSRSRLTTPASHSRAASNRADSRAGILGTTRANHRVHHSRAASRSLHRTRSKPTKVR